MNVCHAKFAPHNDKEVLFLSQMIERVTALVAKHSLPHTHLRFGRQVKSWGSNGVADYHTYTYRGDATKVEFWVNAHNSTMDEEGIRYLEWSLVKGNFRFLPKAEQKKYYDDQDILAYNLKYGKNLTTCAQNRKYFAAGHYADTVLGFNYRLECNQEEE